MDIFKEEWKKIEGHSDYMVCNNGDVVSFTREKPVFLKKYLKKDHYQISISNGKNNEGKYIYKTLSVGKLVADCFLPNPKKHKYVSYKDGNPANLHITNLQWIEKETILSSSVDNRKNKFLGKRYGVQLSLFD